MQRFVRKIGPHWCRKAPVWALGGLLLLPSCYPGGPEDIAELDVVVTHFDENFPFNRNPRYAMPDSVAHIVDPDDPNSIELSRQYDDDILQRIRENLDARGYVQVPDSSVATQGSDVVIVVSAAGTKNFDVYYYDWWGYWGWYPGWGYWPGYGGGWGYYYPGYSTVVSYETGTLFIDMVDPNNPAMDTEQLPLVWNGTINGVLGASIVTTQGRIEDSIDQAFTQSPYLSIR